MTAALAVLAGCGASPDPFRSLALQGDARIARAVTVANGDVKVAGPSGFCVDRASTRDRPAGSFVLLAGCDSLSEGQLGGPSRPALLTVAVGPEIGPDAQPPSGESLETAFAQARPLSSSEGDGLALVQLAEGGTAVLGEGLAGHWRGAFMLNQRLILLGAYGPENSGVDSGRGRDLLRALAAAIRFGTPRKPASDPEGARADQPDGEARASTRSWRHAPAEVLPAARPAWRQHGGTQRAAWVPQGNGRLSRQEQSG